MADNMLNVENLCTAMIEDTLLEPPGWRERHSAELAANIESFQLVPSDHGKFHISVNDELAAFHEHRPDAHLFPDLQDPMKAINERIDG